MTITVESPDRYEKITPEEGETLDDYKNNKDLLLRFQEELAKKVHEEVVKKIKGYLIDQYYFEEDWIDSREETWIEGFDSFDDYGITITVD